MTTSGNVIDFVKYKEDRQRDRAVQYIPYGLASDAYDALAPQTQAMSEDLRRFTENWLANFAQVMDETYAAVKEAEEIVHDIDKLLETDDQEEPLR